MGRKQKLPLHKKNPTWTQQAAKARLELDGEELTVAEAVIGAMSGAFEGMPDPLKQVCCER